MSKRDKRKVVSLRIAPSVLEKLDKIVESLGNDSTNWWNNPHTKKLGYWGKRKVSRADVLAILVSKEYEEMYEKVTHK